MTQNVIIKGDVAFQKKLDGVAAKIANPQEALRDVGEALVQYYQANMDSEGVKLNRTRWKALSPITILENIVT